MTGQGLVEVLNATQIFRRNKASDIVAIQDLTMTIFPGDFVTVRGKSGSGKSTLLNLIGLLLRPTSGEVRFDGSLISNLSDAEVSAIRRDTIGFVFQQFHLLGAETALANVSSGLLFSDVARRDRASLSMAALTRVGLADRSESRCRELSGGEQQRVAIARALLKGPKLILADEPTGNLDGESAAMVVQCLKDANEDGAAVVVVTHDDRIADTANRTLLVAAGRLSEPGK